MRAWLCWLLLCFPGVAMAADPCPSLVTQKWSTHAGTRLAAQACDEHAMWYGAFIDRTGRVASSPLMEGEAQLLAVGDDTAWQRVGRYWRESGLLRAMAQLPGAMDCESAAQAGMSAAACRGFVIDTPWSAAFLSWLARRAALPGFRASASHIGYVRDAYRDPANSAYRFVDPRNARPATGDMLCYVRHAGKPLGHEGLRAVVAGDSGLDMHCDVVVAASPGGDNTAYLIGGNVQQTVAMRLLPLNRNGEFWNLPTRFEGDAPCSPDNESACNLNRQDWAVLLQLKPAEELARLPVAMSPSMQAPEPAPARCCVQCVVGSGIPRCPNPDKP